MICEDMVNKNILVIAPWGSPAQWRTARYVLDDHEVESCCSLIPLLSSIRNSDPRASITVALILLDSLIDRYSGRAVESSCYSSYIRHIDDILLSDGINGYDDIVRKCRCLAERIFRDLLAENGLIIDELEIIVAPCVGSPGGNWSFMGDARDFIAITLYELTRICRKKEFSEIVLDLTHGINFMPAMCMYLIQLLASILMIAHNLNEVVIKVYNSDPYSPNTVREGYPALRLNLMLKQRVKTIHVPHALPKRIIKSTERVEDQLLNSLIQREKILMEHIQAVISSFYYPLPLAACKSIQAMIDSGIDIESFLDECVKMWKCSIQVDAGRRSVKRRMRLIPEAIYSCFLTLSLMEKVRSIAGELKSITIAHLQNLKDLYRLVHESNYYIIADEISKIDKSLRHLKKECAYLYELYDLELIGPRAIPSEEAVPNTRVMIAHAGLQKDFTRIFRDGRIDYDESIIGCGEDQSSRVVLRSIRDLLKCAGLLIPLED